MFYFVFIFFKNVFGVVKIEDIFMGNGKDFKILCRRMGDETGLLNDVVRRNWVGTW